MIEITERQLDDLGKLADEADNLIAASSMNLPAHIHLEALIDGLKDMSEQIKELVINLSGSNPWEE